MYYSISCLKIRVYVVVHIVADRAVSEMNVHMLIVTRGICCLAHNFMYDLDLVLKKNKVIIKLKDYLTNITTWNFVCE